LIILMSAPFLRLADAAAYLAMSTKLLRVHVQDGAIRYIVIGRSDRRRRTAFAQ
jgi:hypothetical protein